MDEEDDDQQRKDGGIDKIVNKFCLDARVFKERCVNRKN